VKKNGEKVMFDRDELARSIFLAVRKRPIAPERVEKIVNSIQRRLESTGESEVQSTRIGELVMEALAALDHVAYIRFASVYRDFREPKDFEEFLETLEKMAKPKGEE
jgi:transcriptional repressor NrdR